MFIDLSLTSNLSRSVCHFSYLYEPLMPREKITISTFHPDRSAEILAELCASVRACQSSIQSFGCVNSGLKCEVFNLSSSSFHINEKWILASP